MSIPDFKTDAKGRPSEITEFQSSQGTRIFLLPIETFPGHVNNLYLILADGAETLFDVGSGMPDSVAQLEAHFNELRERFNVSLKIEDVKRAVISHAHIDHFGGAHDMLGRGVPIWIHELDARVLANFEERVVIASKDIGVFLNRAGVPQERRLELTEMHSRSKEFFKSVPIGRRLRNGDILPGDMEVLHTPGHCPGMICLRIDDILLTADQVLAKTTPNQMPQSITPFTGLENYLRSLDKVAKVDGIAVGLGGHEAPIANVKARVMETADHHRRRLEQCLEFAKEPQTVREFADQLFGDQSGYGRMLAYTEAGAHIEYLHQLGQLIVANLDEVTVEENPILKYRAVPQ